MNLEKEHIFLSEKSYCTILLITSLLGLSLLPLWEVNVFSLDFFVSSMVLLGISIARGPDGSMPVENETNIITFWVLCATVMIFLLVMRLLWKRNRRLSAAAYTSAIILDCIFLSCRIALDIPGAASRFYIFGSFAWKIYGMILLLPSLGKLQPRK